MENHGQIMEILRFFGPFLSVLVLILIAIIIYLWKFKKSKSNTLEAAASETEGEKTGRDVFNLITDLRLQSQNLIRDHKHFEKTLEKLEEQAGEDHDLLIELKVKVDAAK